jgi:hypothetical protein
MLLFIIPLLSFMPSGSTIDRINVKGPLNFNNTNFYISWSDRPNSNYYIQEYLPAGETQERFNQMLTIHLFITNFELEEAVQKKTIELEERKKIDPTCNYLVNESPDGKEFLIDFILGESKGNKMTISEFNIYHYKQISVNNQNAIIVYAYSKRAYGDNITPFLKNLKNDRTELLNEMIVAKVPTVQIK